MDRMDVFTFLISIKKTSSYGFCHVNRPSMFWPDEECCSIDEITTWKSDLRKEQQGKNNFKFGWGMGTNFEKPADIEILLNAFRNMKGARRDGTSEI